MALGDIVKVGEMGEEPEDFKVLYEVKDESGRGNDTALELGRIRITNDEPFITPDLNELEIKTNLNNQDDGTFNKDSDTWV